MDLRTLRYFVAVVDAGGITAASRVLFVSQPSLSQSVRQLEAEMGTVLLERGSRGVTPTAAGRRLHELGTKVMGEADRAAERVRRVSALEVGRLALATSGTLAVHPLTPIVRELRARHPGLEVQVHDGRTPAGVLSRVRAGEVELGLVDTCPSEPGLRVLRVGVEEIVLMQAPGAPDQSPLAREAVRRLPVGIVELDGEATSPTLRALAELTPRPRVRCAHRTMLWDLVRCGAVVAFAGRRAAESATPWAVLRSLDPPLHRPVELVWVEGALSTAGEALVRVVREGLEVDGEADVEAGGTPA